MPVSESAASLLGCHPQRKGEPRKKLQALWYTAQPGQLGTVFGSSDYWTGLGILFDSFDNDNQRNNPYVMAMINDGTRSYDHQT